MPQVYILQQENLSSGDIDSLLQVEFIKQEMILTNSISNNKHKQGHSIKNVAEETATCTMILSILVFLLDLRDDIWW